MKKIGKAPKNFTKKPHQLKRKKNKILELQIVVLFCLGAPVFLCRDDIDVKRGEVVKIIEILKFNRVLVAQSQATLPVACLE